MTSLLIVAQPTVAEWNQERLHDASTRQCVNSQAMVDWAASKGAKTGALIYANNPYGQEGDTAINAAAPEAGIEMLNSEGWDPTKFDFTAQPRRWPTSTPMSCSSTGRVAPVMRYKCSRLSSTRATKVRSSVISRQPPVHPGDRW